MIDRTTPPPFSKNTTFVLQTPDVIVLNGGVNAYILKGVQQDVSKIELILRAGRWYDTKTGISHFTSQMLEKGTQNRSSSEIAQVFDRFGAHLEINSGSDFVSVALYSLNRNLEFVLPVLIEILTEPAFPENELTLLKEIYIQNLKISNEKTNVLASKAIRRNVFGENHPYGSSIEEHNVNGIHQDDLKAFHRSHFHVSEVFVVTNSDKDLVNKIISYFSALRNKPTTTSNEDFFTSPFAQKIEKPESIQASIRLAKKTINRDHSDYFGLLLINHILGGYFGSRLMKNIREEKGLTYGISSSLNPMRFGSLLAIGADVNKENTRQTIDEIKKEIKLIQSVSISAEEIASAKGHFIGSLQAEVANLFAVAEKQKIVKLFALPNAYYQNMISKVSQLSPDDLQKLAIAYLDGNEFFEVVVG